MGAEANAARAEAVLESMLSGGTGEAAEGATAPKVERNVQPSGEELEAQAVIRANQRVQRVHRPQGSDRTRDVAGRFLPDGTPKPKADAGRPAGAKEETMARSGEKTPTEAAEGARAVTEAGEERKDDAGEKPEPQKADEKPAAEKSRADRAREQLTKLRAERKAREDAARAKTDHEREHASVKERSATLEQELAAARAEKARWENARTNPVEGFRALGLEPSQAFLELAEAAKKASTPEAKIDALQAAFEQRSKDLEGTIQGLLTQIQEKEAQTERAAAESEFLGVAKKDDYPYAHAYLESEAERQGIDVRKLWMRAADACADNQRADGKNPSYKSIADEIEEYAREVVLAIVAKLPPDKGSALKAPETALATKAQETTPAPAETKGKQTSIGNALASARISNASRRLTLNERMKKAERLL